MNITLDSAILVRAFEDRGGLARDLLLRLILSEHRLVLSNEILAETSKVLRDPRMRARHKLPDSEIYEYVLFLQSSATMVRPNPLLIAPIRDPNDIIVLQTAIDGNANVICTKDEDFFNPPAKEFLEMVGILPLTDVELMKRLRRSE